MTNEQILKKAISKAIKNGFNFDMNWDFRLAFNNRLGRKSVFPLYYAIIFSHEFAKAFWGISLRKPFPKTETWWKYYLQQMVLEEDPIKYLERFL